MLHQSSKQVSVGLFTAVLFLTVPAYAVKSFKVSNYGGAHQIWFEAEHFDERNPPTDQYYPVVDEAGAFGQAINRAGGAGGMIRWTFDISKAGGTGGTWYFWARQINPSNNSDYMLVEGDPGDAEIPTGPPFPGDNETPPFVNSDDRIFEENVGSPGSWAWGLSNHEEGHTKELQNGENTMYIYDRGGNSNVFWDVFMWTDDPDYVPTDTDYDNATVPTLGAASNPSPADGATDVPRDVVLSWMLGDFAPAVNGHRVHLSENFSDVNDGIGGITHSAGSYAPPQRLDFETTYYWRVDEVNAPPDSTVYEGPVWSFTTEPVGYPIDGANISATASSAGEADFGPEKTIDGSGLDENGLHSTGATDMWLSSNEPLGAWIQYEFDNAYRLHEMWVWNSNQIFEGLFGFGLKDVAVEYSTDGTEWTALADAREFAQAPGTGDYAHNTTVDFGGVPAQYVRLTASSNWGGVLPQYGLSEVRFFYIPVIAREPSPDSGATDVDLDVTLSWRAGREAGTHDVSLSTDEQAVIDGNAPVVTVTDASYSSTLDLGSTYYWRIDEVNDAETPTTYQGDIWSFSTIEYLVVDGFEDYNDWPPHEIYTTWLDGYEDPANGSQVGNLLPPLVETTIVHSGKQSMPLFYDNTAGVRYSEAERTLSPPQDWTRNGIKTLTISFCGDPNNTVAQMYAKLNGVKVVYDGNPADITNGWWQQWNIDLASFGVDLRNVATLAIGFGDETSPALGGSGVVYFDEIRLYRLVPTVPAGMWIEAEAADSITEPMQIYDDRLASGGKYISTDESVGNSSGNPPAPAGTASYIFTVEGGTYRISCRINIPGGSNSFWVRIQGATITGTGTMSSATMMTKMQPCSSHCLPGRIPWRSATGRMVRCWMRS
ncbi:MAG: discoidin domain-containing protein [Planctomycetota bacterium]